MVSRFTEGLCSDVISLSGLPRRVAPRKDAVCGLERIAILSTAHTLSNGSSRAIRYQRGNPGNSHVRLWIAAFAIFDWLSRNDRDLMIRYTSSSSNSSKTSSGISNGIALIRKSSHCSPSYNITWLSPQTIKASSQLHTPPLNEICWAPPSGNL